MRTPFLLATVAVAVSSTLFAQTPTVTAVTTPPVQDSAAKAQFAKAASLYDLQGKNGLDGFHCTAKMDWDAFFAQVSGAKVDADNPMVKSLNAAPMTVEDNLRTGVGDVHWDNSTVPDAAKGSAQLMQDGMKQMWHGFFQGWNSFMNGDPFVT